MGPLPVFFAYQGLQVTTFPFTGANFLAPWRVDTARVFQGGYCPISHLPLWGCAGIMSSKRMIGFLTDVVLSNRG